MRTEHTSRDFHCTGRLASRWRAKRMNSHRSYCYQRIGVAATVALSKLRVFKRRRILIPAARDYNFFSTFLLLLTVATQNICKNLKFLLNNDNIIRPSSSFRFARDIAEWVLLLSLSANNCLNVKRVRTFNSGKTSRQMSNEETTSISDTKTMAEEEDKTKVSSWIFIQ